MEDGLVNMNAGSGAAMVGGGLVDCGDVREMEVCWPSRAGLRWVPSSVRVFWKIVPAARETRFVHALHRQTRPDATAADAVRPHEAGLRSWQ
jgi:hypothetical protein